MANPDWGKRYRCYKCETRFYDLKKPEPICPQCGANQTKARHKPAAAKKPTPVVPETPTVDEHQDEPDGIAPDEPEEHAILLDGE